MPTWNMFSEEVARLRKIDEVKKEIDEMAIAIDEM